MLNLEKIIALIILIICIVYAYTSFVIMQANLLPFELNMTVLPNSLPKVISIFGIVISLFLILKKDEDIEKNEDQSKIDLNNVLNFYYGKALSIIFLMILYTFFSPKDNICFGVLAFLKRSFVTMLTLSSVH